jgi:hypothetical protein
LPGLSKAVFGAFWISDKHRLADLAAPAAWLDWVQSGRAKGLASENTTIIRSIEEQRPDTPTKTAILRVVFEYFEQAPIAFEAFAARVFQMHDPRVIIDTITRGSVDGGRDAIGRYLLGLSDDPVYAEFSLEANAINRGSTKLRRILLEFEKFRV